MKRYTLLVAFSFALQLSGQTWNWSLDGYVTGSGGGTYLNVDSQGTNMTISGLVSDFSSGQLGNKCVETGINDQESNGVQHHYQFTFSKLVNVTFSIDKINIGSPCYDDFLSFTGSPMFRDRKNVSISNNEIIPSYDAPIDGSITVSYDSISEFTITHGTGTSCNPGRIDICSMQLRPVSDEVVQTLGELILFPNPARYESNIANTYDIPVEVRLFNMRGQLLSEQVVEADSRTRLDMSNYASGVYLLLFLSQEKMLDSKRLVIQRE